MTHDSEAQNDFWLFDGKCIHRHHFEPRGKLYVPEEEAFPISLRFVDVVRRTDTTLDVLMDWNVDGDRNPSQPWTFFTQFTILHENFQTGKHRLAGG